MKLTRKSWNNYISILRKLDNRVASEMSAWVTSKGIDNVNQLIEYAFALTDRYGLAAASLACQMYDNVAEASKVFVPPAEPAELASMTEVAKAVNATKSNTNMLSNAVSKYIRLAAADTMLKNAKRDKAQFAWIPSGDSCAFCFALASNGWRNASEEVMKGNHAVHVHANCDCTFAIRFSDNLDVEGYDPDSMREEYESYGNTPNERINGLRRKLYAKNKNNINTQKRAIYANKHPKRKTFGGYGAFTNETDPYYEQRAAIANKLYEEIRNRKPRFEIERVAKNANMEYEEVERVYNHIFVREHLLEEGKIKKFDPSYEMAQSWQRLSDGKNIKEHDIILLKHELEEERIMGARLDILYEEAHNEANKTFDYGKALKEYLEGEKGYVKI